MGWFPKGFGMSAVRIRRDTADGYLGPVEQVQGIGFCMRGDLCLRLSFSLNRADRYTGSSCTDTPRRDGLEPVRLSLKARGPLQVCNVTSKSRYICRTTDSKLFD